MVEAVRMRPSSAVIGRPLIRGIHRAASTLRRIFTMAPAHAVLFVCFRVSLPLPLASQRVSASCPVPSSSQPTFCYGHSSPPKRSHQPQALTKRALLLKLSRSGTLSSIRTTGISTKNNRPSSTAPYQAMPSVLRNSGTLIYDYGAHWSKFLPSKLATTFFGTATRLTAS